MIEQDFSAPAVEAFARLVRAHAATTRCFSASLQREHGLTLNEFEVLLRLARAPERRLKRIDLVEQVLLTPSGITRLLDRLERAGLVAKDSCASDARVTYAVLTDAGAGRLRDASRSHTAEIRELMCSHYSDRELSSLAGLLRRLDDDATA
ncbi:MAG TPA: MarR family transcriptional regulator [Gaiellales bacterium]|nr:MarR family transcriptional regulator [Gaiellales bacterium]